jgi:hypothetical protein
MRFVVLVAIACAILAVFFMTRVPVHWQTTYANVPYEKMVDCLEQKSATTHTVGPRAQEHRHSATVPLYDRGTINLAGQYEVEKSGNGTHVTWRDVKAGQADDSAVDRQARERADTCARPANPSGS